MANFDDIYWAHQPPEIRGLKDIADQNDRSARAAQLAAKGFTIDVPIMVWLWDPLQVMQMRQSYGYTWVPSAMMTPVTMAPGLSAPGQTPYDPNHPPAGSIKVSTDPADYPPYDPPAPPPAPDIDPVGNPMLGLSKMFYALAPAQSFPDGTVAVDSRGKFLLHRVQGMMGDYLWFEQIA